MKKQVCVIGLGRFGGTVAKELYQSGHDVLAIDIDEGKIQDQLGLATYSVRADATSESVLRELDVPDYDVAIVALGGDNVPDQYSGDGAAQEPQMCLSSWPGRPMTCTGLLWSGLAPTVSSFRKRKAPGERCTLGSMPA